MMLMRNFIVSYVIDDAGDVMAFALSLGSRGLNFFWPCGGVLHLLAFVFLCVLCALCVCCFWCLSFSLSALAERYCLSCLSLVLCVFLLSFRLCR